MANILYCLALRGGKCRSWPIWRQTPLARRVQSLVLSDACGERTNVVQSANLRDIGLKRREVSGLDAVLADLESVEGRSPACCGRFYGAEGGFKYINMELFLLMRVKLTLLKQVLEFTDGKRNNTVAFRKTLY